MDVARLARCLLAFLGVLTPSLRYNGTRKADTTDATAASASIDTAKRILELGLEGQPIYFADEAEKLLMAGANTKRSRAFCTGVGEAEKHDKE